MMFLNLFLCLLKYPTIIALEMFLKIEVQMETHGEYYMGEYSDYIQI